MADDNSEKVKFPQLKEENYPFWKFQMKQKLQYLDLWDIIEEDGPAHPGNRPEENLDENGAVVSEMEIEIFDENLRRYDEWKKRDGKAMNKIAEHVDPSNANEIYNVESGKEA